MGRLSKNTDLFVKVYDAWMDDEQAYVDWVAFFKQHVSLPLDSLLELACGSGNISKYLVNHVNRYIASDLDEAMLVQAKAKLPEHVIFMQMNMQHIPLDETFDCIICGADSMNFNQNLEELHATATTVWNHLNDHGKFVFDIHHIDRINQYKQAYVETGTIQGIDFEYVLSSTDTTLVHEFYWYLKAYPITQQYIQRVFTLEEIRSVFLKHQWKLTIKTEDQKESSSSKEKWFIVAEAIKS